MTLIATAAILLAAFAVSYGTTRALIPLLTKHLLDRPNTRSSHTVPTPRSGGLGIVAGIGVALLVSYALDFHLPRWQIIAGAAAMAAVGLADDRFRLSVKVRLPVQLAAAALVVYPATRLSHFPLPTPLDFGLELSAVPLSILWIVGMTNLYNFLDGIDGYAAVQGIIGGLALFAVGSSGPLGSVGIAIAGASAGFLILNWRPAKIFMGDVGSSTIGFLFAALPFQVEGGEQADAILLVALALWFFFSDGFYTFLGRLLGRHRVWEAHRTHLYQRLVISGLAHDYVVIWFGSVGALLTALAVVAISRPFSTIGLWAVIVVALCLFTALIVVVRVRESRSSESTSPDER